MGSSEWYLNFLPKNQSYKLQKLESRLLRPWILFPYKSLKTEVALTLKLLLLWLSNCWKLLILGCSFTWCKLFVSLMFVYDKNKDTPLWIGSMILKNRESARNSKFKDRCWCVCVALNWISIKNWLLLYLPISFNLAYTVDKGDMPVCLVSQSENLTSLELL